MAGKKVEFDDLNLDDLEGLDDLDFDGDDLFPDGDTEDSRSPTSDLKKSTITAFKDSILGRENIKKLIGASLGKGFSEAIDTYDELSKAVSETVGANENEGRRLIRDITGIVDETSPKAGGKIPEWLRKVGDDARDEIDSGGDGEEDDGELNAQIGGIKDLLNFSKRLERDKLARDSVNRIKDAKIASAGLRASADTLSAIRRLSAFNEKVTINYQRKSLEQGYRIINILSQTHRLHMTQYELMNEMLGGIQKNTGLPDFVKMRGSEFIKESIRQRLAEATTNRLTAGIAPIVDRIKGRVQEGIAGIGMVTDQFSVDGGINPFQMIGGLLGDWLGEKATNLGAKAIDQVKPHLAKMPGFNKIENLDVMLRRFGGNLPMLLNTLSEEGHDNEWIDRMIQFVAPDQKSIKLHQTGMEELEDPSYFDVRTHRTINEIIPAYLSSMDRNLHYMATGETKEEQRWDHFDGQLAGKTSVLRNIMDRGVKDNDPNKVRYEVDRLLDEMGAWDMTVSSQNALRAEITKILLRGVQFQPHKFMEESMWKEYPGHVHREVRSKMKSTFGITDEGEFESAAHENRFWDFHRSKYESTAKSISDYTGRFGEYTSLSGSADWLESGILTRNAQGELEVNNDRLIQELLNPTKDYSFKETDRARMEKEAKLESEKAKFRNLLGAGRSRIGSLFGRKGADGEEFAAAATADEEQTVSQAEYIQSQLSDDGAVAPDAIIKRSWRDRIGSMFSRDKDTSVSGKILELKALLTTKSLDDILGTAKTKYDQTFTPEKAKEMREFLTGTRAGRLALKHLKRSEEAISQSALGGFGFRGGRSSQTEEGFARGEPVSTGVGDQGTHLRLDALNEIQLANQAILTEMLEITLQLPDLLANAGGSGIADNAKRNQTTRIQRLSRFMRSQGSRLANSKIGKFSGNVMGLVGTGARSAWSAGSFLGRTTLKTARFGASLVPKAMSGAMDVASTVGSFGLNTLRGAAGMLPGMGRGLGSLASGAGSVMGAAFRGAGSLVSPLMGGLGSAMSGGMQLAGTLAKSPIAGLKLAGNMLYGGKDEYRDYDAYVKGEESPRIASNKLKTGSYTNVDGDPIKSLDAINGAVYDENDNVVISEAEYESKLELFSASGKSLIKLGTLLAGTGRMGRMIRRITRPVRKITRGATEMIKGVLNAPFKLLGGIMGRLRSAMRSDNPAHMAIQLSYEQLGIQSQILQILKDGPKREKKGGQDSDGDGVDDNSWAGIKAARAKSRQVTLKDINDTLKDKLGSIDGHMEAVADNTSDKKKGIFKRMLDGIMSLGPTILGAFSKLGTAISTGLGAVKSIVAGKGLIGGALALGKSAIVGGASLLAKGALWLGGAAVSLVGAPALIIAGVVLAVAATGYFLYKGYKGSQAKKLHITYLRMLQYGINPADEDAVGKVAAVEAEFSRIVNVRSQNGKVHTVNFDYSKLGKSNEAIFTLFGVDFEDFLANQKDTKHQGHKLLDWLYNRFLPVYKGHVHAAYNARGKVDLSDLDDTITGAKGLTYLADVKTALIQYFRDTRYKSPAAAFKDRASSPFYSNWFSKDVWATEDDIQKAYDRAEVHFRKQDTQATADPETGLGSPLRSRSDSKRLAHMKSKSELMVSNEGTGDLREINRDIKGGGLFTSVVTANNFKSGDVHSMTRGLKRLDTGTAIRYMTYGLTSLNMIKVEQLYSLESYVLELMPALAKGFEYPTNIYEKAKAIFRPQNEGEEKDLNAWLHQRFLRILGAYVQALKKYSKDIDLLNAYSKLTPFNKYLVISVMNDASQASAQHKVSVWDLEYSPWSGYAINQDASSVDDYYKSMETYAEQKELKVEESKSLLTNTLKPKDPSEAQVMGKSIPNLHNTAYSGNRYVQRTQGNLQGTSLLMAGQDNIITSGKAHKPLKGPGNEIGEAAMLAAIREAGITDHNEIAMILGQVSEETGRFNTIEENLNYRADRLIALWPKRFKHRRDFARKLADAGPEAIANEIYGGRMGNTQLGDGWKYRGRGYIQLTGKDNYRKIGDYLGMDLVNNPDLVTSSPEMAAKTAVAYWMTRGGGIREAAQRNDVKDVSLLINGGYNGLDVRKQHVAHYRKVLPDLLDKPSTVTANDGNASEALGSTPAPIGSSGAPKSTKPSAGAVAASEVKSNATKKLEAAKARAADSKRRWKEREEQLQERQRGQSEAAQSTQSPTQITVEGDAETKGIMDSQLSVQELMAQSLASIEASMAELNSKTGSRGPAPKSHPSRTGPSPARNKVVSSPYDL